MTLTVKPQWPVEEPVAGAALVSSPCYPDSRGWLYESFHVLKFPGSTVFVSSVTLRPKDPNTVYGVIQAGGETYLNVFKGAFSVGLCSADFQASSIVELIPGKILHLNAGVLYGIFGNGVLSINRTYVAVDEVRFHYLDPRLRIAWPDVVKCSTSVPLSIAPQPRYDFAVVGWNGMIGQAFVREMTAQGFTVYNVRSRLEMHQTMRAELASVHPVRGVVVAAGLGTRPNTKYCEDHRLETIDINVTSQLAIGRACRDLELHCTLIGTSGFYHYDDEHTLENGVGFLETDLPSYTPNFYYRMRAELERRIAAENLPVLNLRALFPFDHKVTTSSLVGKLLRFPQINCIPTSMTVLPPLVPLALRLIEKKAIGNVNWNCRGAATNGDVVSAYRDIIDPAKEFKAVEFTVAASRAGGNSAALVVPKVLIDTFGEESVPEVHEAIAGVMRLIKAERS